MEQTWDKYTNVRVQFLHPLIIKKVVKAINRCESELGVYVRVTSDGHYRDDAVSDEYYTYSRTQAELEKVGLGHLVAKPSKPWKTDAKGGESYHNYGLAIDTCLIADGGKKAVFSIPVEVANIFIEEGFEQPLPKNDSGHFQMTFGLKIKDLKEIRKANPSLKYPPIVTPKYDF